MPGLAHTTYARRKAQHQCPECGTPVQDMFRVYCAACRAARTEVYRGRQTLDASAPGPNLIACCNRFWPITSIPFQCPRCHKWYFLQAVSDKIC